MVKIEDTFDFSLTVADRFIDNLTDKAIIDILDTYYDSIVSPSRKLLLEKFLKGKRKKLMDLRNEAKNE